MGERLAFTFALTGRREWGHGTQGVALGSRLVGLSARTGPQTRLFPHNHHQFNISILNTLPERAASPQLMATPWVSAYKALRPVRAKVINNRCAHTFALTGRRRLYTDTQGVALGWELAALSGRSRRNSSFAPARPRNSLIRVIRCYAVRGQIYYPPIIRCNHFSCAYPYP